MQHLLVIAILIGVSTASESPAFARFPPQDRQAQLGTIAAPTVKAEFQCSAELGGEFVLSMSATGYPAGTWVDFFLFPEDFYLGGFLSEGRTITQMIGGFVGIPFQPTPFTLPAGPHTITANIRDPMGQPSDSFLASPDTDLDGWCENKDNCPSEPNPDQSDLDFDAEGDVCDLNDGLILLDLRPAGDIRYQEERGFSAFNIYRGDLGVLRAARIYTQDPSIVPTAAQFCYEIGGSLYDPQAPSPNGIVFYLITGLSAAGESSLGTDSAGNARPNDNPCP